MNDPSSRKYKDLEEELISWCECVSSEKCGNTISHCRLIKFRKSSCASPVNAVEAEFEVEWTLMTPLSKPPSTKLVAKTLQTAAATPGHSKTDIFPTLIQVTGPVEDVETPPVVPLVYTVTYTIDQRYTEELNNPNSNLYKYLAVSMVNWCESATLKGGMAISCQLKKFREHSSKAAVEAVVNVEYNGPTSSSEALYRMQITDILRKSAETLESSQIIIIPDSIQVSDRPVEDPTTAPPIYKVTCSIDKESFTVDLNNRNSQKYKDLEENLVEWCESATKATYGDNVLLCRVINFSKPSSPGSTVETVLEVELRRSTSELPSRSEVGSTLKNSLASPGLFSIHVIPSSILISQ
ncbi:uncharacterized protein ACB058_001253 [Synchiropus picturatus]